MAWGKRKSEQKKSERNQAPTGTNVRDRLSAYNTTHHGTPRSQTAEENLKAKPLKPFSNNERQSRFSKVDLPTAKQQTSFKKANKKSTRTSDKDLEFQKTYVQHTKESPPKGNRSREIPSGRDSTSAAEARKRLSSYNEVMGKSHKGDPNYIVPLLAAQAYHIPGNSFGQDWIQFMKNNHPLFGICLHHKLHPIKSCTRIVALIGTILFGLVMTNIFYLFYLFNPEFDQEVLSFTRSNGEVWTLTTGMLLLWTVGSGIHASFNLCMWYIAACSCCRAGGCFANQACCPSFGKHSIRVMVLMIALMAIFIVLMRVAISNADTDTAASISNATDANEFNFFFTSEAWDFEIEREEEFDFVLAYLVQMFASLFVFYPLIGTILMTGMCGLCTRFPLIGGRPYEVKQWENKKLRNGKEEDWELCAQPTIANSEGSDINPSDRDSCHDDDIELVWTPKAGRRP